MANTITIQFGAKGDKDVIDAINKLDASTKKLIQTQVKLTTSSKSQVRQMTASQKTMTGMLAKLKAVDLNFKKIGVSTKVLTKAYQGNKIAIEKVRIAIRKYRDEQEKADITTRILGGTFAVLRSKLLLVGFAMATVGRPLARIVGESAKIKDVSTAFATLSGSTESASVAVGKLEKATDGTMTSFELFKQANNAMILGVTKNSDEMAEMFDMAQRLGEALGRDTTSSVESLVTGIGRQSRLMLDNIGIIVDSEKAYQDYAKELRKSAKDLTDSEKKQAFLNATLESARQKVKNLPPEVETASKIFKVFGTQLNDLGASLGTTLTPIAVGLTKLFTALVSGIDAGVDALNAFFGLNNDSRTVEGVNKQLKELQEELLKLQGISVKGGMLDGLGGKAREQKIQKEINSLLKLKETLTKLADERKKIDEEQKQLEDEKAKATALSQERELTILQERLHLIKDGINAQEQLKLLNLEDQKIREDFENKLVSEFDLKKKILEIDIKRQEIADALNQQELAGISLLIGNLGKLNDSLKGSTLVSARLAQAQAIIDTYAGANKAFAQGGVLGFVTGAAIIAQGLANVAVISRQVGDMKSFESGGVVGGKRHSQGGTIIEAEQGEFVMSRNAVQSIGVEALNQMNQGGGAGITLNISAPLVDETIVDTIIPAIQKAQRMNLA
tara:strand:+ start:2352 stop:4376 length:2025 start_codon:yes stop_codon:yes gene_type:complete